MPLKKCDFCDFEKFCFYTKIKVCFLSRTLLNLISSPILTEKKQKKIFHFLIKSMGLEKSDFWVFENFSFYTKRNVSFLSRPLLKLIFSPILTEKR